jgi:bud site selection protein 20
MGKVKRGNKSKSHAHKTMSHLHKKYKTKRKTKDFDQIHVDLQDENFRKLLLQPVDYEVAGNAQNYCVHCAFVYLDNLYIKLKKWLYLFFLILDGISLTIQRLKLTSGLNYTNEGTLKKLVTYFRFLILHDFAFRIKKLQIEPYTQAEANRAGGIGSYIAPKLLPNIKTQPEKSELLDVNMNNNEVIET